MAHAITHTTLLVHNYDEAIRFFTTAMRFTVLEDTPLGGGKRWVLVAPGVSAGAALLLAEASTPDQMAAVGKQAGDRVFLFLQTDDFQADHQHMLSHGVRFAELPRHELYGTVAVFLDMAGNKWDLVQRAAAPPVPSTAA